MSDWNPKWLLNEQNAEIRRGLIQQVGDESICQELAASRSALKLVTRSRYRDNPAKIEVVKLIAKSSCAQRF